VSATWTMWLSASAHHTSNTRWRRKTTPAERLLRQKSATNFLPVTLPNAQCFTVGLSSTSSMYFNQGVTLTFTFDLPHLTRSSVQASGYFL